MRGCLLCLPCLLSLLILPIYIPCSTFAHAIRRCGTIWHSRVDKFNVKYECGNSVVNKRKMGMNGSSYESAEKHAHKPKGHTQSQSMVRRTLFNEKREENPLRVETILRLWQILINIFFFGALSRLERFSLFAMFWAHGSRTYSTHMNMSIE